MVVRHAQSSSGWVAIGAESKVCKNRRVLIPNKFAVAGAEFFETVLELDLLHISIVPDMTEEVRDLRMRHSELHFRLSGTHQT